MKSLVAALRSIVLPWGKSTGTRIVLDGDSGTIRIYDSNDVLIAELSPTVEGGGLWTRGVQSPHPLTAFIGGGKVQHDTVDPNTLDTAAIMLLDTDGSGHVNLIMTSGLLNSSDQEGRVIAQSTAGGGRGRVFVTPDSTVPPGSGGCDLEVFGAIDAHDLIDAQNGLQTTDLTASGDITGLTVEADSSTVFSGSVTVGGDGGATWTTRTYQAVKFGRLWWVSLYFNSSGAGSGTSTVTFSLPFTPDRSQRQVLNLYGSTGSTRVDGDANVFVGGSGAMLDTIRASNGSGSVTTLRGQDITSNDFYTVQGWLLEA